MQARSTQHTLIFATVRTSMYNRVRQSFEHSHFGVAVACAFISSLDYAPSFRSHPISVLVLLCLDTTLTISVCRSTTIPHSLQVSTLHAVCLAVYIRQQQQQQCFYRGQQFEKLCFLLCTKSINQIS